MKRKRILCLVIPSLQPGGMERVMSRLIHNLAEKPNIELHLILYGIKRDVFYPLPIKIQVHHPKFIFNNHFRLWCTTKTLWFLRQKVKELKPHAVLSFGELWNNFVLLALYGTNFPVYVSDRCQPDKKLGAYHEKLRKWLYPMAVGLIIQTDLAKRIYQQKFHHPNIKVIGNPIGPFQIKKPIHRENIILSVGRLIQSKHHDELIKSFARINNPEWRLVIVGDDALKQQNMIKLKKLISALEMSDRIELTGSVKDVASYYMRSKIFAFTSSSEGFPNVVGEALAAGLPVVAFDCIAGPADMIKDGENGYLVDLFDYSTFTQRLRCLMENENLLKRLALNAPLSMQKFDEEMISEQFYEFITSHL